MNQKQEKEYIDSKTTFRKLPIKEQVQSLLYQQNFKRPTVVQADSLPITLQQNLKQLCIILYSYNGSGKTLSYIIPILNSLEMIPHQVSQKARQAKQVNKYRPQAIIVFPTQALMSQVNEYLQSYANYYELKFKWPLKIGRIYSNFAQYGHIIVGLTQKICEFLTLFELQQLKWVVFDQCDRIKEASELLFKKILNTLSKSKVTSNFIITSATGEKQEFREFIQQNLITHNVVQLDSRSQFFGLKGVTHYYSKLTGKHKIDSIIQILSQIANNQQKIQVIIFFNQIKQLQNLYQLLVRQKNKFVVNNPEADQLGKNNLNIDYVHARCGVCKGNHRHEDDCKRSKTARVKRLRNGEIQVLLGTETIARGIDIRTVTLVINDCEPMKNKQEVSSTVYIHRVGRTGRYSDEGIGLTYIDQTNGPKFIKIASSEQKIQFKEMINESQIVQQALICSKKNSELTDETKHRYEQQ